MEHIQIAIQGKPSQLFKLNIDFLLNHLYQDLFFLDAGQTGNTIGIHELHLSKGFGFHVKVGKGNASLRFEKGYSEDHDKFYVNFNHAF